MLDREFQRELLEYLKGKYPNYVQSDVSMFSLSLPEEKKNSPYWEYIKSMFTDPQRVEFHLSYLREHGLIEFGRDSAGFAMRPTVVRVTVQGIDMLADDGGPSAIRDAKSIKFDVENIRKLITKGLLQEHMPEEKREALNEAIQEAPGSILQTAVYTMVEKAMSDPAETAEAVAGLFGVSW